MSKKIIQLNEEMIKSEGKKLVHGSVEELPKALRKTARIAHGEHCAG